MLREKSMKEQNLNIAEDSKDNGENSDKGRQVLEQLLF